MDYSGITPAWQALLERAGVPACYAAAVAESGADNIAPAHPDILRAFRCTAAPEEVAVVIVGQDPYHTVKKNGRLVADGLAFSTRGRVPPSLINVLKAAWAERAGARPRNGSLQHWAAQGILLTNAALTVSRGGPAGGHRKI